MKQTKLQEMTELYFKYAATTRRGMGCPSMTGLKLLEQLTLPYPRLARNVAALLRKAV